MKVRRATIVIAGLALVALLACNLVCWNPKVGGDSTPALPDFSRDYGWPFTYRFEIWEFIDWKAPHQRPVASLFSEPRATMRPRINTISLAPLILDLIFGITLFTLTVCLVELLPRRRIALLTLLIAIGLIGVFFAIFNDVRIGTAPQDR